MPSPNTGSRPNQVLALLDNPTILAQWQLTRDDLPLLIESVAQLNIHWGSKLFDGLATPPICRALSSASPLEWNTSS